MSRPAEEPPCPFSSPDYPRSSLSHADAALHSLTSKTVEALSASSATRHLVTHQMREYKKRLGLETDKLRIIHIAGTKGKGSTAAFCESLALQHSLTCGLFTSPHLVRVTERFRLNGQDVSDQLYLKHFWRVWDILQRSPASPDVPRMPAFFRFLTLVALSLFSEAGVQMFILEVGIGGRLDCTNLFSPPQVVVGGISSLGFDHMEILGPTLKLIAREKAGICKPGVPVFTCSAQDPEALATLVECAVEEGTSLTVLSDYIPQSIPLGLSGLHQYENATLAVALVKTFMERSDSVGGARFREELVGSALREVHWAGRCQILPHRTQRNLTFFIDGAHTDASVEICVNWFKQVATEEEGKFTKVKSPPSPVEGDSALLPTSSLLTSNVYYSLLFNCGHVRNPFDLLAPLVATGLPAHQRPVQFGHILTAPFDHDRPHLMNPPTLQQICNKYEKGEFQEFFKALKKNENTDNVQEILENRFKHQKAPDVRDVNWQHSLFYAWDLMLHCQLFHNRPSPKMILPLSHVHSVYPHRFEVHPSVASSLSRLLTLADRHPQVSFKVLVTGSLYLVGNLFHALKYKP